MDLFAWLFQVEWDGWRQFCEEMNVDPDVLLGDLPGDTLIESFVKTVPHRLSEDELSERMDSALDDTTLRTADEAHARYRQVFLQISEPWA